ncbi:hypothetical protein B566_EDAN003907 [Ephemera danica]|nr:hypothetical protein B566_EDAN003907 [Ephemera danica]
MNAVELLQHLENASSSSGQQVESEDGWKQCISLLSSNNCQDERVKFFCFQVIEHFIKHRYSTTATENQLSMREFLCYWIQIQCIKDHNEKKFLRNKAAQIFSLVFVRDYPHRWITFFTDLIQTFGFGPQAVDHYLRVLMAIDSEVTDHDIPHTTEELERNNLIKNAVRESDVDKLVSSWFHILDRYQNSHPQIASQCMNVIGAYISWIEISLIANDQFVPLLVEQLQKSDTRESAADCLHSILSKGMDPISKAKLVESLCSGDETDFTVKIMMKHGCCNEASAVQSAIESKVETMLEFLGNEYDDVSAAKAHAYNLLAVVVNKMKYDESYNFDSEGEDEALKVLYENVAGFDKDMVLEFTEKFVTSTLSQWQTLRFDDVEVAIYLLYITGEAIPVQGGNHFSVEQLKGPMSKMMRLLVTSDVSLHPCPAVKLQFFETVVRHDKFFNSEPEHIGTILTAFLDKRGLSNESCKVRSRCAYLFSRLVKSHRSHLQNYTKLVLHMMKDLLIFSVPTPNNGMQQSILSEDDQLFEKELYIRDLLSPMLTKFPSLVEHLIHEPNEKRREVLSHCLCHAMALTSRISKAFSHQQSMKASGCVNVYKDTLQVFLCCLQVQHPNQRRELHSSVRQYLHRMVVCLEEELLPYIPSASELLLKSDDISSFQEYVPLIIQLISKYRKDILPFLQQAFMPITNAILNALAQPVEENDEQALRELQQLQRSYFQFLASIVTNNVQEVLELQDIQSQEQVMTSIIYGAVDVSDPVVQKTCFSILKKLVDLRGGKDLCNTFNEYIYKSIIPACFLAPSKPSFDLRDAQNMQTLAEIASCMKTVYLRKGEDEVTAYLQQLLPTLNVNMALTEEYCQALKADTKVLKSFLKYFFHTIKT